MTFIARYIQHLCAIVAFALPLTSLADAIFIDESVEGAPPVVTSTSPNFLGYTVDRPPEAVSPTSESWHIRIFVAGERIRVVDVGGQSGVVLVEPITGAPSDYLRFANEDNTGNGTAFIDITLFSDDESGQLDPFAYSPGNAPVADCGVVTSYSVYTATCAHAIEDGSYQLAVSDAATSAASYDIYLRSDVPEPASLALLGLGLAGLGFSRRKQA